MAMGKSDMGLTYFEQFTFLLFVLNLFALLFILLL